MITQKRQRLSVEIDLDVKEAAEPAACWFDHAVGIFDSLHMDSSSGICPAAKAV